MEKMRTRGDKKMPIQYAGFAVLALILAIVAGRLNAQPVIAHDPVAIQEDDTYHVYCTGKGILSYTSTDLVNWKFTGPVFNEAPSWVYETVKGFPGHIWAPDIQFHKGKYYLYYSISAFGKNTSCIGVATNTTLDTASINYKWEDHGFVVQSVPNRDMWNAIDPNIAFDDEGNAWMVFGSFWLGMKMVRLDSTLLRIAEPEEWYTLARRPRSFDIPDAGPGDAALEAPFIFKKNGYYYLFVSYDHCCRGIRSDYKIMVGRAKNITGPYLDKEGKDMFLGGASLMLKGDEKYPGVGHNSAYTFDGQDYLIFHAYDAEHNGRPVLRILKLNWDDDLWPVPDTASEQKCEAMGNYKID